MRRFTRAHGLPVRIVLHPIRRAPHTLGGQPECKLIAPNQMEVLACMLRLLT
jgi:hypothetical protein